MYFLNLRQLLYAQNCEQYKKPANGSINTIQAINYSYMEFIFHNFPFIWYRQREVANYIQITFSYTYKVDCNECIHTTHILSYSNTHTIKKQNKLSSPLLPETKKLLTVLKNREPLGRIWRRESLTRSKVRLLYIHRYVALGRSIEHFSSNRKKGKKKKHEIAKDFVIPARTLSTIIKNKDICIYRIKLLHYKSALRKLRTSSVPNSDFQFLTFNQVVLEGEALKIPTSFTYTMLVMSNFNFLLHFYNKSLQSWLKTRIVKISTSGTSPMTHFIKPFTFQPSILLPSSLTKDTQNLHSNLHSNPIITQLLFKQISVVDFKF
ncbi:hypothetical protein AGLY_007711 [Aphis glycines]|uniref:Uncharacterized protein n=1 Tax=Aphis glycines TaxID=307491 RepID=A0A6G0TQ33_APHGL|nr:hypothetical protein AGLY_007711 [Aphis glycines]